MILALDGACSGRTGFVGMVEIRTWLAEEAGFCGTTGC